MPDWLVDDFELVMWDRLDNHGWTQRDCKEAYVLAKREPQAAHDFYHDQAVQIRRYRALTRGVSDRVRKAAGLRP